MCHSLCINLRLKFFMWSTNSTQMYFTLKDPARWWNWKNWWSNTLLHNIQNFPKTESFDFETEIKWSPEFLISDFERKASYKFINFWIKIALNITSLFPVFLFLSFLTKVSGRFLSLSSVKRICRTRFNQFSDSTVHSQSLIFSKPCGNSTEVLRFFSRRKLYSFSPLWNFFALLW